MKMESPGFTTRIVEVFTIGNNGVVVPYFTAAPGTSVEDMVESCFNNTTVTHHCNLVPFMALNNIFNEDSDTGAEMHHCFATLNHRRDWRERPLAIPIIGPLRRKLIVIP